MNDQIIESGRSEQIETAGQIFAAAMMYAYASARAGITQLDLRSYLDPFVGDPSLAAHFRGAANVLNMLLPREAATRLEDYRIVIDGVCVPYGAWIAQERVMGRQPAAPVWRWRLQQELRKHVFEVQTSIDRSCSRVSSVQLSVPAPCRDDAVGRVAAAAERFSAPVTQHGGVTFTRCWILGDGDAQGGSGGRWPFHLVVEALGTASWNVDYVVWDIVKRALGEDAIDPALEGPRGKVLREFAFRGAGCPVLSGQGSKTSTPKHEEKVMHTLANPRSGPADTAGTISPNLACADARAAVVYTSTMVYGSRFVTAVFDTESATNAFLECAPDWAYIGTDPDGRHHVAEKCDAGVEVSIPERRCIYSAVGRHCHYWNLGRVTAGWVTDDQGLSVMVGDEERLRFLSQHHDAWLGCYGLGRDIDGEVSPRDVRIALLDVGVQPTQELVSRIVFGFWQDYRRLLIDGDPDTGEQVDPSAFVFAQPYRRATIRRIVQWRAGFIGAFDGPGPAQLETHL